MEIGGFALAATTNNLELEREFRDSADLIEFRMDKADNPVDQLASYEGQLPIIATNRTQWFGGKAEDTGRLDKLFAASRFESVKFVDIEVETVRAGDWIVGEFRDNDVDLIISHHDFTATPNREVLNAIFEQCADYGDIAKVATFPNDKEDTLALLDAVNAATEKGLDVAGIAMGEIGSHTRAIGHLYGSKLGYAPLETDETEYAPGQIPVNTLASIIEVINRWGRGDRAEGASIDEVPLPGEVSLRQ